MPALNEFSLLYSFRRCPFAMRARWALLISGHSCIIREIVLRDKPVHLLELSPKGTVPVLLLQDETVIEESLEIMLWALEKNDPENWLREEGPEQDDVFDLIKQNDEEFKHHLDRHKYASRYENIDPDLHRVQAEKFLEDLEKRLQKSVYLFGDRRCIADIALAPFVRQYTNFATDLLSSPYFERMSQWLDQLLKADDFARVMTKYEVHQAGAPKVFFPPA